MNEVVGKRIGAVTAVFALLVLSGYAAADDSYIYGKIYEKDTQAPVPGADVRVVCDQTGDHVDTMSLDDGTYDSWIVCPVGTTITVNAEKDGKAGSEQGTIDQFGTMQIGIAMVDVPILAPEVIGALGIAIVLAPSIAYLARRKKR
jgi:hypothetical protein